MTPALQLVATDSGRDRYDAVRVTVLEAQAAVCRARANLAEVTPGQSYHEREEARAWWLREAADCKRLADEVNFQLMHRNDATGEE